MNLFLADTWWRIGGAVTAAFVITMLLIVLLEPVARRIGLIDHPGGRRVHVSPTPLVGGVAIFAAAIPLEMMIAPLQQSTIGLGVAALVLMILGVADDLWDVRWYYRLLGQAVAAMTMIEIGGVRIEMIGPVFGFGSVSLGMLSTPFTVLATVGVINAVNMADGLDGLAGSLALVAMGMLAGCALYAGNNALIVGLLILMGGIGGFLVFNLRSPWRRSARVFLGNAGAEFLGLVIAWASFRLTQNPGHPVSPVLAPFLLAPPVIDCLVLIVRRVSHGRSPFAADRNHLHHMMMDAGFSTSQIVFIVTAATVAIGIVAALARKAHVPQPLFVVVFLALTVAYYGFSHNRARAVRVIARLRPERLFGKAVAVSATPPEVAP